MVNLFKMFQKKQIPQQEKKPVTNKSTNYNIDARQANAILDAFDGEKFEGGFGVTKDYQFVDYWTLRMRSLQLFTENIYAKGLINRLITNEINSGLKLEANPPENFIDLSEEEIRNWSQNVEVVFGLWSDDETLVDWSEQNTFSDLQRVIRLTSLISGDVLIILRQSKKTGLIKIQLVDGSQVQNPLNFQNNNGKNRIVNGIEIDERGRHVAYHVRKASLDQKTKDVLKSVRIPAKGEKTKRNIAFMVYGSDKRVGEVRGIPLLSCILQSMKDLDRYADAELRAAMLNSLITLYIEKTEDKPGSKPFSSMGGVVKKERTITTDTTTQTQERNITFMNPGMMFEELQTGEKIVSFDTKRPNVNFGEFRDMIIDSIAWSLEIPPEILRLQFNNNFSASRQATSEFKTYLQKSRSFFTNQFNKIIYKEWLISMIFLKKIIANGFVDAWLKKDWITINAWFRAYWRGAIKPSVDIFKEAKAYEIYAAQNWISHEQAAAELTGTDYINNVKRNAEANKKNESDDVIDPDLEDEA